MIDIKEDKDRNNKKEQIINNLKNLGYTKFHQDLFITNYEKRFDYKKEIWFENHVIFKAGYSNIKLSFRMSIEYEDYIEESERVLKMMGKFFNKVGIKIVRKTRGELIGLIEYPLDIKITEKLIGDYWRLVNEFLRTLPKSRGVVKL